MSRTISRLGYSPLEPTPTEDFDTTVANSTTRGRGVTPRESFTVDELFFQNFYYLPKAYTLNAVWDEPVGDDFLRVRVSTTVRKTFVVGDNYFIMNRPEQWLYSQFGFDDEGLPDQTNQSSWEPNFVVYPNIKKIISDPMSNNNSVELEIANSPLILETQESPTTLDIEDRREIKDGGITVASLVEVTVEKAGYQLQGRPAYLDESPTGNITITDTYRSFTFPFLEFNDKQSSVTITPSEFWVPRI